MKFTGNKILLAAAISSVLAGCNSDGISVEPKVVDNSVDNSVTNPAPVDDNPCAAYDRNGSTMQGSFDGLNCTYGSDFVDNNNELLEDLTIPALANQGAHIFKSSLFVGKAYDTDADLTAAGIVQGGDANTLTIEAGAILAFQTSQDFVVVNRGSQIVAEGTADSPITFTSVTDIEGNVEPEAVQQWGGMVINGFGVTNKCAYTGTVASGDLATENCHVAAEGAIGDDASWYGGDNNADSSGSMQYVVVKHTGAEVASGDELNGISFGGVGSGTMVENLQVYSTYDDGIEMFGGAVSFKNFVALYVRDDSIDIDEGWSGSIENALVIQSATDGNHCIESDGIGSYSKLEQSAIDSTIAAGLNSRPVISNLTCIISPNDEAVSGTHGDGAGWRFREGIWPMVSDSLVIASFGNDAEAVTNYCLRIDNAETAAAFASEDAALINNIFSCVDKAKGDVPTGYASIEEFATATDNLFVEVMRQDPVSTAVDKDPTANMDTDLQLLEGSPAIYSIPAATAVANGVALPAGFTAEHVGGVTQANDWTFGWTYGIHPGSRAQSLWFEQ